MKQAQQEERDSQHRGARAMQSQYRGRVARKQVHQQRQQMNGAASTMQANFRG